MSACTTEKPTSPVKETDPTFKHYARPGYQQAFGDARILKQPHVQVAGRKNVSKLNGDNKAACNRNKGNKDSDNICHQGKFLMHPSVLQMKSLIEEEPQLMFEFLSITTDLIHTDTHI